MLIQVKISHINLSPCFYNGQGIVLAGVKFWLLMKKKNKNKNEKKKNSHQPSRINLRDKIALSLPYSLEKQQIQKLVDLCQVQI